MAQVNRPNTIQVLRHPTSAKSHTASRGMLALARPFPVLAMEMARPRLRMNQREIMTLTTM